MCLGFRGREKSGGVGGRQGPVAAWKHRPRGKWLEVRANYFLVGAHQGRGFRSGVMFSKWTEAPPGAGPQDCSIIPSSSTRASGCATLSRLFCPDRYPARARVRVREQRKGGSARSREIPDTDGFWGETSRLTLTGFQICREENRFF